MSCEFLSSLARGFYQGLRLRVEHKTDSWRGNKLDVLADCRATLPVCQPVRNGVQQLPQTDGKSTGAFLRHGINFDFKE
jgi:hypothetical protein